MLTPLPRIKSPVDVIGDSALKAAEAVVCPVPPFPIGSVPVTPVVSGNPVAFVRVADDGVPNAGVTNVGDVANTMLPEPVTFCPKAVCTPVPNDVIPVPPLAMLSVPLNTIAPVVALLGVNPVVPALNEDTPPEDAAHDAVVPFDVNTYPLVPMARRVALLVPFPIIKSPVEVIGDNALNAADAVVCPVPPFAMFNVPPNVSVPDEVIGPPVTVNPVVPPDPLTLVTVPTPEIVVHAGSAAAPLVCNTCPDVPGDNPTQPPEPRKSISPCVLPILLSKIADSDTAVGTPDADELLDRMVNAACDANAMVRLAVKSPPPVKPDPAVIVMEDAAAPMDAGVIDELDAAVMRP